MSIASWFARIGGVRPPSSLPDSPLHRPGAFTWRRAAWPVLAAAAAAVLALLAPDTLEERSRDGLTAIAPQRAPVPGVVVVDISEESLRTVGAWPWRRSKLADLVEELVGPLGARAVALDMVLPEPADREGDARLASLAAHGPLTLAHVLDFERRPNVVSIGSPAGGAPVDGGPVATASGYVANHAGLEQARCVGHIGIEPDPDGTLRRIHLHARAGGHTYPTLGLALMSCVDPGQARQALANLRARSFEDERGWRIPFRRTTEAFDTLRAEDVLSGAVQREAVVGRYVLVGSSAVGLSDYVATPLQPVTAGVLVHAQVLSELLQPPISAAAWGTPASLVVLVVGLAGIARGLAHGVRAGLGATGLAIIGWLGICAWGLAHGWNLRVLPAAAAFAGFAIAWISLDFAHARRLSRQAMTTLAHYVAAPVLRLLVRQGLQRSLIPTRQQITVLVADMAGYTRLTAESTLEDSARLTTDFLEAITPAVLEGGGTLDRYTGDGLIAFWGAPLPQADHAQCALDAARRMLKAVAQLNIQRGRRGEPALAMRIGIESGEALVGDLGSSARSVYTAVGSCINLASRLQELARDIGETVVVGPLAQAQVREGLRALGPHRPRGTDLELAVFALDQPEPAAPKA